MYYDLIASLPHLPHFAQADHSPVTGLRVRQRLRLLKPEHADQLDRAHRVARWRPDRVIGSTDASRAVECAAVVASPLAPTLREYVAFRMEQQTFMAALRRKHEGTGLADKFVVASLGPRTRDIQRHWNEPDFGLALLHPWLPQARELLAAGNARGLEQLLMEGAWRRLDRCTEGNMFGFEAVFSYWFKWDILQAWLACDAKRAETRFKQLIDQVTHVEHN